MSIDWGIGHYERTGERLLSAAREAIAVAAVQAGERVLDVGCGTGNAALLAAERGAVVVGVDPAQRLLEVARRRASEAGRPRVEFLVGEAAALPVPAASFDVVVSVFAAVFAPDAASALAEMVRVLAPNGRIVLTSWIPGNPISRMNQAVMGAMREVTGAPPPAAGVSWHEPLEVAQLAAPFGLAVDATERSIAFTDSSPSVYLAGEMREHPMALSARAVLEPAGRFDQVRQEALDILTGGNEDPAAFRVTSTYLILTLRAKS